MLKYTFLDHLLLELFFSILASFAWVHYIKCLVILEVIHLLLLLLLLLLFLLLLLLFFVIFI